MCELERSTQSSILTVYATISRLEQDVYDDIKRLEQRVSELERVVAKTEDAKAG